MYGKRSPLLLVSCIGMIAGAPEHSWAASLTTLFSFDFAHGEMPAAGLIADASGNLFGTTSAGGARAGSGTAEGTVFEIAKTAGGYASTPTTLVTFIDNDANGWDPRGELILDLQGNLFGTTSFGGVYNDGTVFELAKTVGGYASTPITLVSFSATDGALPQAGLIRDANGNLFGTTALGGLNGDGTVFEIAKTAGGYATVPTTLVSFSGFNGAIPYAPLIADAQGNLFGTTYEGGPNGKTASGIGAGTVFEIAKVAGGYSSTPTTLVGFNYDNGSNSQAGLIADAQGNLFGTTSEGGPGKGGTVFEVTKGAGGYASSPTTLVSFIFRGSNGAGPTAGVIADAKGSLFGTTGGGGLNGSGTVFKVAKTSGGYASTVTTLGSFDLIIGNGSNGLIADASGNLLGTTAGGSGRVFSPENLGTVFQVTGTGFVVPSVFAGTPGARDCFWTSASALVQQYHGVVAAAAALGYPGAWALRKALVDYCYCHQPHPR